MARTGRPLVISAEIIETITTALSNGLTRETSAKYARITYQTLNAWYNRGKAEKERIDAGIRAPNSAYTKREKIFLTFLIEVDQAETDAVVGWQDTINRAARTDPAWAYKMLTLRDPRGYRSTDTTATFDLSKANREQLQRIANGEDPITVMADTSPGVAPVARDGQPTTG